MDAEEAPRANELGYAGQAGLALGSRLYAWSAVGEERAFHADGQFHRRDQRWRSGDAHHSHEAAVAKCSFDAILPGGDVMGQGCTANWAIAHVDLSSGRDDGDIQPGGGSLGLRCADAIHELPETRWVEPGVR